MSIWDAGVASSSFNCYATMPAFFFFLKLIFVEYYRHLHWLTWAVSFTYLFFFHYPLNEDINFVF